MRLRRGFAVAAAAMLAVVSLLASGCASSARLPVFLPVPKAGEVTFYLSLPGSTTGLGEALAKVATPGSSDYRHFSSLDKAARRFGASDAQINTVAKSVKTLGLQFAADPTRLFGRVSGSTQQWQTALGTPLSKQAATASSPFITYTLPAQTPAALQPSGTSLLLPQTLVYDPTAEGNRPPNGMRPTPSPGAASTATPTKAARPFPFNTGTPLAANCSSPLLAQRRVYAQQQVQTAYGIDTLRAHAAGTPVITVLDLGGGWLADDLKLAGQCFGYAPPDITQTQGDGVAAPIGNADDETSLDLQTAAAVAPRAQLRLVQSTLNGVLDGFSRALGDPGGVPDVISVSFGGCAIAENQGLPAYTATINAVLAMTALAGVSSFVAAGDSGSTTCGTSVPGTTLSYPAVSPFVTAVGGTRLTLGAGNTRVSETVWNDSVFGVSGAGGGGVARRQPRPAYQDGANAQNHRAVPDVSALADIVPGWPDVINSTLQTVGGTSGSTPFVAAATALVAASERQAGRPRVGLANGWFYKAASQPSTFFDVTQGSNDLAGVGCCQATVGYDPVSGLGVPNWATLPAALPRPG
jgi:subtilase family serine protease